jgi:hypothetical protein
MNDDARARYRDARAYGGRERFDRAEWLKLVKKAVEFGREVYAVMTPRIDFVDHMPNVRMHRQVVHIEPDYVVVKHTQILDIESSLAQMEGIIEVLEDSLRTKDRFERRIHIESAIGKMRYLLGLPDLASADTLGNDE